MIPLTIGTWNVHTLIDNTKSSRPERRTSLVARQLNRYHIQIAVLSEIRLAKEGHLLKLELDTNFSGVGRVKESTMKLSWVLQSKLISAS